MLIGANIAGILLAGIAGFVGQDEVVFGVVRADLRGLFKPLQEFLLRIGKELSHYFIYDQ